MWHELYVADSQKAIDFYKEALDFGIEGMPMGEMGTYNMLTRNGQPVAGILSFSQVGKQDIPPHWATYLSVDDVDKRIDKCVGMGATLVVPAMDVPGIGRMALIADPQGAHIWLFKGAG